MNSVLTRIHNSMLNKTTPCEMLVPTDTGLKCKCGKNAEFKCKTHPKQHYCEKCYIKHSKWHKARMK